MKKINSALLKQVVVSQLSNLRTSTANTKTRGETRGGGRKPWKQKGTGNARAGSRRSPIWVGGGITFGPTSEKNYKKNVPTKMAIAAKAEALRYHLENKTLIEINEILIEPKTKAAVKWLADQKITARVLIITPIQNVELMLATNNLPNVEVVTTQQATAALIMQYPLIVVVTPKVAAKVAKKEDKNDN